MAAIHRSIVVVGFCLFTASAAVAATDSEHQVDETAESEAKPTPELRWLHTELFSIQIPASWIDVAKKDLKALREQGEEIGRGIFPSRTTADEPLKRVLWANAFDSPDRKIRIILLISQIPQPRKGGRSYIAQKLIGYLDLQRAKTHVDRVSVGEVESLNGLPAVEVVVELPKGQTLYTANVWTSVYGNRVGTIVVRAEQDAVEAADDTFGQVLASVEPSEGVRGHDEFSVRRWIRDNLWNPRGASDARLLVQRTILVLSMFAVFLTMTLRLFYQTALLWYRYSGQEDRLLELARQAARDLLRLGVSYSQRVSLACALFSMLLTAVTVLWIVTP